jgi:hypothetical protein
MKFCYQLYSLVVLLTATIFISGCTQTYRGEGAMVPERRDVGKFNRLVLSMNAVVIITDTLESSCVVIAQQNIQEAIVTRMDGNTLVITSKGNLETEKPVEIAIGMNKAEAVEVNGTGEVSGSNTLKNESFDFEVNGSGKLMLDLVAVKVTGAVTGSGLVKLSGSANALNVEINGSGTINAGNFSVSKSKAKISGSGSADLTVGESLQASVSGSGVISYRGNAVVDKKISGSGEIRKLD